MCWNYTKGAPHLLGLHSVLGWVLMFSQVTSAWCVAEKRHQSPLTQPLGMTELASTLEGSKGESWKPEPVQLLGMTGSS